MTGYDILRALDKLGQKMCMTRPEMGRVCGAGTRAFDGVDKMPTCRDIARLLRHTGTTPRDFADMMRE